jgi:hypothetical protein
MAGNNYANFEHHSIGMKIRKIPETSIYIKKLKFLIFASIH